MTHLKFPPDMINLIFSLLEKLKDTTLSRQVYDDCSKVLNYITTTPFGTTQSDPSPSLEQSLVDLCKAYSSGQFRNWTP